VKSRPVIAVTGPQRGGLIAWWMTAIALRRCGAKPVRVTPRRQFDESELDALVIGGGSDVDPFHYGEEQHFEEDKSRLAKASIADWLIGWVLAIFRATFASHTNQGYDPQRDKLEKNLVQHAVEADKPILGICRGAQLMNVTLGGSLYQDIGHFYTEETSNVRSILPRKTVSVTPQTLLRSTLGVGVCAVNALHDQSIKQLGDDILVSASETNGVIQAIEKENHVFFVGVQWHPEYIPQSTTQQGLFRALVSHARQSSVAGS